MRVGIIAPIPLLHSYSTFTDYHICNPELLLSSQDYLDFYKSKVDKGDYVIIDSSFSYPRRPHKDLVIREALEKLRPSAVIAPDWDMNAGRTVQSTLEFLRTQKSFLDSLDIEVIGVIQGASLDQYKYTYNQLYPSVGALGLPRSIESSVGRPALLQELEVILPVHILGIHTSAEDEVDNLLDLELSNLVGLSCDIAVRLGFACRLLDEVKPEPPLLDMESNYNPFPDFTFKNVEEFILLGEGDLDA